MKATLTLVSCGVFLASSVAGRADSLTVDLFAFTGDPAHIAVNILEVADGDLKFTVSLVEPGPGVNDGDISGFWGHIADESLLAGLSITGGTETIGTLYKGANAINNLPGGGGQNLNGNSPPGSVRFDFGFRVGDSNGNDDIESFMFVLQHATEDLDLADFDGQWFGARLQSTGARRGSSKLVGRGQDRPPGQQVASTGSAGVFFLMGLGALEFFRRRLGAKG